MATLDAFNRSMIRKYSGYPPPPCVMNLTPLFASHFTAPLFFFELDSSLSSL